MAKKPKIEYLNRMNAAERRRIKEMSVKLQLLTEALTRRDLADWRRAWQMAINVDNPNRTRLLNLYTDVDADLHLTGCVQQRMGFVLNKSFKLCDAKGVENPELTELLEAPWFKEFLRLALESNYYGHSLIELGDVVEVDGRMAYNRVSLIPRTHVIPEYGVIITHENDTWQVGYDYRNSEMKDWCIEAGGTHNLGLYLKCAQQTIPKRTCVLSGTCSAKSSVCRSVWPPLPAATRRNTTVSNGCCATWEQPLTACSPKELPST